MVRVSLPLDKLQSVEHDGRQMIKVPWDAADLVHERLRARGIVSTLHLQPSNREAFLETQDRLGLDQVRSMLGESQAA